LTLPAPRDEPGKPIHDKTPWRIPKMQEDRARLCIRAAEMRSKGRTYVQIAEALGLDNAIAAKRCTEVGYGLAPGDDLRTGRRRAAEELDMMRRKLWDVIDGKHYKVAANGTVPLNPHTGEPLEDPDAVVAAIRALAEVNKHYRTLLGTDAPKLSASMIATGSLEDIRAQIEETRRELERAEREAGDGDALPALPPVPDGAPHAGAYAGGDERL